MSGDPNRYPPPIPTRVQPLTPDYGQNRSYYVGRPGAITTIGVLSCVMGGLAIPINFWILILLLTVSHQFAMMKNAQTTAIQSAAMAGRTYTTPEYVPRDGLGAAQRQIVLAGMGQKRAISSVRQLQFDALLSDAGQKVIQLSSDYLTADSVAAYVTGVNDMPDAAGGPPFDVFVLGSGRLQLSDKSAVFYPAEGGVTLRASGGIFSQGSITSLAAVDVGAVIQAAQTAGHNSLSPIQQRALAQYLETSNEALITAGNNPAGSAGQITAAPQLSDGTVTIITATDSQSIDPSGQVTQGIVPMPGNNLQFGAVGGPGPNLGYFRWIAIEALLSAILAVYLLVCGIFMLKGSRSGRLLHLIYCGLKLTLLAGVGIGAYTMSPAGSLIGTEMFFYAPGAIYVVVMLVVLNLPDVRGYYAPARMPGIE